MYINPQPSAMRRVYAALLLLALGLIFGILEKQGDPVRYGPQLAARDNNRMTMPCTWLCKRGDCNKIQNRKCVNADLRRE